MRFGKHLPWQCRTCIWARRIGSKDCDFNYALFRCCATSFSFRKARNGDCQFWSAKEWQKFGKS